MSSFSSAKSSATSSSPSANRSSRYLNKIIFFIHFKQNKPFSPQAPGSTFFGQLKAVGRVHYIRLGKSLSVQIFFWPFLVLLRPLKNSLECIKDGGTVKKILDCRGELNEAFPENYHKNSKDCFHSDVFCWTAS